MRVMEFYDIFKKRTEAKAWSKNLYEVIGKRDNEFTLRNSEGDTPSGGNYRKYLAKWR